MYEGPLFLNLRYFYLKIYNLITSDQVWNFLVIMWAVLKIILISAIPILVYLLVRELRQAKRLRESYVVEKELPFDQVGQFVVQRNQEWEKVQKLMASKNPSDWKLAIIDADKMLDELTKSMQYHGESLGERLKAVEPSDFLTLQNAWEAHKIRNQIAHEPGFALTERIAKQTIAHYQAVFEEFELI